MEESSLTTRTGAFWQWLDRWLYLQPGYTEWLRRLTGLCGLPIGVIIWTWTQGGPGPYIVPAWRIKDCLLYLPLPPPFINMTVFVAYGLCCGALVLGSKQKFFAALPAIVLAYYGSRDWMSAGFHFDVLLWIMFIALLFDQPGRNPCRRIIQISVAACYFYAALSKLLYPDFISGCSFEAIFNNGLAFGPSWVELIKQHPITRSWWLIFSWLTIAVEFFFPIALFIKKTRLVALISAIAFHTGISIFLDPFLFNFTAVICSGLLAFVDKKGEDEKTLALDWSSARKKIQAALAFAFCLFLVLFPARDYILPERPLAEMTGFDRSPWGFCMYLQCLETTAFDLDYLTDDGVWHKFPSQGRMKRGYTDNEVYAAAHYIFDTVPSATEVRVRLQLCINHHICREKTLVAKRNVAPGKIQIRTFAMPAPAPRV